MANREPANADDDVLVPRSWGARSRYEGVTLTLAFTSLVISLLSILVGAGVSYWIYSRTDFDSRRASCLQALSAELAESERIENLGGNGFRDEQGPTETLASEQAERLRVSVASTCFYDDLLPTGWGMRTDINRTAIPSLGNPYAACAANVASCTQTGEMGAADGDSEPYNYGYFDNLRKFSDARETAYIYVAVQARALLPWEKAPTPTRYEGTIGNTGEA